MSLLVVWTRSRAAVFPTQPPAMQSRSGGADENRWYPPLPGAVSECTEAVGVACEPQPVVVGRRDDRQAEQPTQHAELACMPQPFRVRPPTVRTVVNLVYGDPEFATTASTRMRARTLMAALEQHGDMGFVVDSWLDAWFGSMDEHQVIHLCSDALSYVVISVLTEELVQEFMARLLTRVQTGTVADAIRGDQIHSSGSHASGATSEDDLGDIASPGATVALASKVSIADVDSQPAASPLDQALPALSARMRRTFASSSSPWRDAHVLAKDPGRL